jgi:protein-S-isoprenylcysteine O-methyltransferase Ste14
MAPPPDRSAAASAVALAALAVAWVAILRLDAPVFAFAFFLLSRMAYVGFAGVALRAQDGSEWWTRRWGPEGGFLRYRRAVSVLMNNDGVALALVCWTSRGSLPPSAHPVLVAALGGLLVALGIGMKSWAARTLGPGSYHWRSFFLPAAPGAFKTSGPYRWFRNPMYTVGYAHAYGLALLLRSTPGLIAALVAQSLILLLNHWAERPHTERMRSASPARGGAEAARVR